jgi:hypothetical protein
LNKTSSAIQTTDAQKAIGGGQAHQVHEQSVPLFATQEGNVVVINYGANSRKVLKRSDEMEQHLRKLGTQLIAEHKEGKSVHDGILYMMLAREGETLVPLYIGKAETFGKGDRNLSANIRDLANGTAMFGRWGYNYAYHIGDLSAVTLSGHPDTKASIAILRDLFKIIRCRLLNLSRPFCLHLVTGFLSVS